jgi:hypothetical protein
MIGSGAPVFTFDLPRVPLWAVPQKPITAPAEAAFYAGAEHRSQIKASTQKTSNGQI